jgi:hypothetical protein
LTLRSTLLRKLKSAIRNSVRLARPPKLMVAI